jgi:hypothetical protein
VSDGGASGLPSPLPAAVSRALRQAQAHPSVISVEVVSQTDDFTVAKVTIRTELPAAWRAKGESPFGVRKLEDVTLGFSPNFPLSAPAILLRPDFPRFHPHINPSDGKSIVPCLVLGSPREVIQARGFLGLIEQLVLWLERAAELDLNDPKHGWEPVRRDSITDVVVLDEAKARALVDPTGGMAFAFASYIQYPKSGSYRAYVGTGPVTMGPAFASLLKRDHDETTPGGAGAGIFVWAGSNEGGPITAGFYLPETVENLADLKDRASLYGCADQLDQALNALGDAIAAQPPAEKVPIVVLLLARRPYNLVGSDSPIEICPYLIEASAASDLLDPATPVRLAGQRAAITPELLRRASRDDTTSPTLPWTLIGAGSVGSKIALHGARAGRAPTIVVDRASMSAHNYARHSTLPIGTTDRLLLRQKATLVAEQAAKLGQNVAPVTDDAVALLTDDEGRLKLAPDGTQLIVDTTASIVTREALAHAAWLDRPRAAEACLMGAGRIAYLALEGPAANPNLSDLVTEAYRRIAKDPEVARKVFGVEAEAVVIGQGCSAATFPMPDHELSFLSAALAQPILQWSREGLPAGALTRIGITDGDGGLSWQERDEPEWIVVPASDRRTPTVRLHPRVDHAISEEVARYRRVETGGVLVGRFSTIGNCFQIVDVLPAPPDSKRSRHEFVLGRKGLQASAKRLAETSGGALQVLGTWHSHLKPSGPSMTDAVAGAILAFRQFVPALLLIHTPAGYRALIADARFESDLVA